MIESPESGILPTDLTDDAFNIQQHPQYQLRFLLKDNRLAIGLRDTSSWRWIRFQWHNLDSRQSVTEQLKQISRQNDWLLLNFQEVEFRYFDPKAILIPLPFKETALMARQFILQEDEGADHKLAPINNDQALSWAIPDSLNNYFHSTYNQLILTSSAVSWLQDISGSNPSIHAYLNENHFEIAAFDKERLRFYNCYPYKTAEDVLYFLQQVCHYLGMNSNKEELNLSGEIEKDSQIYRLLYRYFRNPLLPSSKKDGDSILSELPPGYFQNLFIG